MQIALYVSVALILVLCVAHSFLGERFILTRLFRRGDLPKLFGSTDFTKRTLRFAWHLTSVAWLGLAGVLVVIANPPITANKLGIVVGVTLIIHGLFALFGSRGKHLSWPLFLAAGIIAIYATRT